MAQRSRGPVQSLPASSWQAATRSRRSRLSKDLAERPISSASVYTMTAASFAVLALIFLSSFEKEQIMSAAGAQVQPHALSSSAVPADAPHQHDATHRHGVRLGQDHKLFRDHGLTKLPRTPIEWCEFERPGSLCSTAMGGNCTGGGSKKCEWFPSGVPVGVIFSDRLVKSGMVTMTSLCRHQTRLYILVCHPGAQTLELGLGLGLS